MSTLLSVPLTKAGTTEEKAHVACAPPQQQRTKDLLLFLTLTLLRRLHHAFERQQSTCLTCCLPLSDLHYDQFCRNRSVQGVSDQIIVSRFYLQYWTGVFNVATSSPSPQWTLYSYTSSFVREACSSASQL